MADVKENTAAAHEGWDYINHLYDVSVAGFGRPMEMRLFDTQLCENLRIDWLAGAVASSGIDRAALDATIRDGLVCTWKNAKGTEGYILYSEYLARRAHEMREAGRHTLEELQHIFADWHGQLQIVTADELGYESMDIDDYEHFRRRAAEMSQFFADNLERANDGPLALPAEQWEFRRQETLEKQCRAEQERRRAVAGFPASMAKATLPAPLGR